MNQYIVTTLLSIILFANPFPYQKPHSQASQEKVLYFGYMEQNKIVSIRYSDPNFAIYVTISTTEGKEDDGLGIIIRDDKIRTVLGSQENPYREYEYIKNDGQWIRIEHSSNTMCATNQDYLEREFSEETRTMIEKCLALKQYVAKNGADSARFQIIELVQPIATHYGK